MSRPLVYSIVLTWNNFTDTDECLATITQQDYDQHQIVVVDNGSTDGSIARLKERWHGKVRFVENKRNLGVPGGYNAGIRLALRGGADYVLLLNNDIIAQPQLINALLKPFQASPMVALTGPIIVYYDRRDLVWFARATYDKVLGYARHIHLDSPLSSISHLIGKTYQSHYIPACAVMISRRALEAVGLMDCRYFLYYDDIDWCFRARMKGLSSIVVGQPLVAHKVALSSGDRGSNVLSKVSAYYYARNAFVLGTKHVRGLELLPFLLGQFGLRLPYYSLRMALAGRWSGIPSFVRGMGHGLSAYLRGPALIRRKQARGVMLPKLLSPHRSQDICHALLHCPSVGIDDQLRV